MSGFYVATSVVRAGMNDLLNSELSSEQVRKVFEWMLRQQEFVNGHKYAETTEDSGS